MHLREDQDVHPQSVANPVAEQQGGPQPLVMDGLWILWLVYASKKT
jgi:hypothetical protein